MWQAANQSFSKFCVLPVQYNNCVCGLMILSHREWTRLWAKTSTLWKPNTHNPLWKRSQLLYRVSLYVANNIVILIPRKNTHKKKKAPSKKLNQTKQRKPKTKITNPNPKQTKAPSEQ